MAHKDTTTMTVEITESVRNMVLNGLHNELLDAKRYLSGSKVADEPGPMDSCCEQHLLRYEDRKSTYIALKARKKAAQDAIALFEALAPSAALETEEGSS